MYKISQIILEKNRILGEMPNIEMPTMGGHVFWETKREEEGYRLQVNMFTNHARILNKEDYRIAWGTYDAMLKKYKILTCADELQPGDIIGVKRLGGLYEHYGVYIGDDKVIHYAGQGNDFGEENSVHEATMEEFLKGGSDFFVLDFPDEHGRPAKLSYCSDAFDFSDTSDLLSDLVSNHNYHLYSPEETVERAKSRLGETEYNLIFKNCEHFAIWCKTGVSESHQVNNIIQGLIKKLNLIK